MIPTSDAVITEITARDSAIAITIETCQRLSREQL